MSDQATERAREIAVRHEAARLRVGPANAIANTADAIMELVRQTEREAIERCATIFLALPENATPQDFADACRRRAEEV